VSIFGKLFGSKPNVPEIIFNRFLLSLVLALTLGGQTLCAQQGDADVKKLAEIRAKAEKGDAKAQVDLGVAFCLGQYGLDKDQQKAAEWYHKAAEQNNEHAQINLGFCYSSGMGVAKDDVEAVKWFRKSAEQNNALAQVAMGDCYGSGIGVAQDLAEALKWYRKAAEQNFAMGQRCVGEAYFKGIVVEKNMPEAYKWFLLAAAQGDEDAKGRVRYLEKKLKKDQIAEVKKQADGWARQYEK